MKKARLLAGCIFAMIFTIMNSACVFADTQDIHGHLDSIEGNAVAGWLWDQSSPDLSQAVTVTVKNRSTGEIAAQESTVANEYREDLVAAGKGTGNYGFHVEIVWDQLPDASYSVSLSSGGHTISQTLTYVNGSGSVSGNLVSLGTFVTTAYCPCYSCSEGWGRHTSSGALATAGHTVAVDPKVIPIGSHLLIDGVEYVAEDIGGGVKGNHIDIYYNTHGETRQHGVRHSEVFLISR